MVAEQVEGCTLRSRILSVWMQVHIFDNWYFFPDDVDTLAHGSTINGTLPIRYYRESLRQACTPQRGKSLTGQHSMHYKHDANIKETINRPQQILATVRADAPEYGDVIRCSLWDTHDGETGNSGLLTTNIRWNYLERTRCLRCRKERGYRESILRVKLKGRAG